MLNISLIWKTFYKLFDFQAGLIVSVKPNEILNKTSSMILNSFNQNKNCCDFAILCSEILLGTANYNNLSM